MSDLAVDSPPAWQRPFAVVATVVALLALSGCTTSKDDESTSPQRVSPSPTSSDSITSGLEAIRDCMVDAGWDVKVVEDGGAPALESEVPDDQADQYDSAMVSCQEQSDLPEAPPNMTAAEADQYYNELLEVAKCLEKEGFETTPPPSRQAFIDATTRGELAWDPLDSMMKGNEVDMNEFGRANEACPLPR